jgi:hypothetical protein
MEKQKSLLTIDEASGITHRMTCPTKVSLMLGLLLASTCVAQSRADRIIVHKKARTMELIHAGQVIKTYKIASFDSARTSVPEVLALRMTEFKLGTFRRIEPFGGLTFDSPPAQSCKH